MTSAFMALLTTATLMAGPAWRGALTKLQPDGTTMTYYLHGDEHYHYMTTADGQLLEEDEQGWLRRCDVAPARSAKARTKASDYQIGTFPTMGDAHGLVILVQTSDKQLTFGQQYHQRLMNEEGFSEDGNNGSARDYFIAQSHGLFRPTFDVVGPVTLSRTMSYYGRNDSFLNQDENAEVMIVEACKLAHDQLGIDFSQYDYDEDGFVDMVYVIFAGYGENAGGGANTVWPKKWSITAAGQNLTLDGKKIDVYACSAELFGNSGLQSSSIGSFCHEFGHVLGFADHYSTQNSSRYELGSYDLMDYGVFNNDSRTPPSYNAMERMTLGWMEVEELTQPEDDIALEDIQTSNRAYRITSRRNPNEFYLLENRQQTGWDAYLPGEGLMITHCDFDMSIWNANEANYDDEHRRFYLVCADGDDQYDYQAQHATEAYDLYPSCAQDFTNNQFTDHSAPAAKPYTGEVLDKWVTNIRLEDHIVRFDFMGNHLKTPRQLRTSNHGDEGFTASWTPSDERANCYKLLVTHLKPEAELTTVMDEGFDKMTDGQNQAGNATDIGQQLDSYLSMQGWTGENVFQAGGNVQMGMTGIGGQLVSPAINFSTFDRSFAVLVKVNSQQGSQPVFSVSANGMQGRTRITSTPRMFLFQFENAGLTATTITLASQGERAYIDSLIILRGTEAAAQLYPKARSVSISGTPESTVDADVTPLYIHAEQTVYTDITDTLFTVTGLEKDQRYALQVKALSDEAESEWSPEVEALVSKTVGIYDVERPTLNIQRSMFNVHGHRVFQPTRPGIYIIVEGQQRRKYLQR